jgi:hypothetical protein
LAHRSSVNSQGRARFMSDYKAAKRRPTQIFDLQADGSEIPH